MKMYKNYETKFIGESDIAALILVGMGKQGVCSIPLPFGEDGSYRAYITDENAEIGSHYRKVAEFSSWLKIYDDDGLSARYDADQITVYRAGLKGYIIQLVHRNVE